MGCPCNHTGDGRDYLNCAQAVEQRLTDDSTITQFAARAGARSSDFTMCLTKACLLARRIIYYKVSPGDCGTNAFDLSSNSLASGLRAGIGSVGVIDPEPITKGILSGITAVIGLFGAAHAQAVVNEETTICKFASSVNGAMVQLEQAVKMGQLSPDQASSILAQVQGQLDPFLAGIAKPCNAACGYRIAMHALLAFMTDLGFPALAPANILGALSASDATPSPGAPGTYGAPGSTQPLPGSTAMLPGSNFAPTPGVLTTRMNGTNMGTGPTSGVVGMPSSFPAGALVLIGGVLYLASRPSVRVAAIASEL